MRRAEREPEVLPACWRTACTPSRLEARSLSARGPTNAGIGDDAPGGFPSNGEVGLQIEEKNGMSNIVYCFRWQIMYIINYYVYYISLVAL